MLLLNALCLNGSSLKYLNLNENTLDAELMGIIGKLLQSTATLEHVDLECCDLNDDAIKAFAPFVFGNTKLNNINISRNNRITEKSASLLVEMLEKSHITGLFVVGTLLTLDDQAKIFQSRQIPIFERKI